MGCQALQNEIGGKSLLLKVGQAAEIDVDTGTGDDPTAVLLTAHGLIVGDLVRFDEDELGTHTEVNANQFYFVKQILDEDSFRITEDPGPNTSITFLTPVVDMEIEIFKNVGGLRAKSFSISGEVIENSEFGTTEWRSIVSQAGLKSVSFSGSGVYTNKETAKILRNKAFTQTLVPLVLIDVVEYEIYDGDFKVSGFEFGGGHDAAGTFSMSADSSGEINVTAPGGDSVIED